MKTCLSILCSLTLLSLAAPAWPAAAQGNPADHFVVTVPFVAGYTFDGRQHRETRPAFGIRAGYNFTKEFGAEALFDYVLSRGTVPGIYDNHTYRFGADALWHFRTDQQLVPFVAVGAGGITTDFENAGPLGGVTHFHQTKFAGDWGGGVKYYLNDYFALRADVRQLVIAESGVRFNYEYGVGASWLFDWNSVVGFFRPTRSQKLEEIPPEEVPAAKPAVKKPAPVKPAAGKEGAAAAPAAPAGAAASETAPAGGAETATGAAAVAGSAGVAAGELEAAPVVPAAEPTPGRQKYCSTHHIEFDVASTRVKPEYFQELDDIGDFMKRFPTTTAVIEGHTDNVGPAAANLKISQQRAEAVVAYLAEKHGLDRSRFAAKGYGASRPIADNATDAGKAANRRIEAIVDCPVDVKELAPPAPPERLCVALQVEYDTGRVDIKPAYHDELAKVGDFMRRYPTTHAVIEGHTDNVGGYEFNMKLSQERAERVVDYLVKNFGIDRSRLSAKGYGYTRNIAYNNTPAERQKNRRINAIIDCVVKK